MLLEMVEGASASTPVPKVAHASTAVQVGETVTRRRRRTRAEIDAVATGGMEMVDRELVTCRRRRSRSEMMISTVMSGVAASPTGTIGLGATVSYAPIMPRHQRHARAQLGTSRSCNLPLLGQTAPIVAVCIFRRSLHPVFTFNPCIPG